MAKNQIQTPTAAELALELNRWRQQCEHCSSLNREYIYRVTFSDEVFGLGGREFFFSSLSAIYQIFTPEQIGCNVKRLWNLKLSAGNPYTGRLCRITRVRLYRAKRIGRPHGAFSR